ncbi:DUF4097 family beta strand repeat-containing protein [Kitasatospora sp. NPDC054939]
MQTFATTAPIAARLDIPAGKVQFLASDRTDTTVEVSPADSGKARDVKAAEQTEIGYADSVLTVRNTAGNKLIGTPGSVEITVHLPAGSTVEAKTATAEFHTAGRLGEIAYDSAHGAVRIAEAAGARVTLQAGDVLLGRLAGNAEITTSKGDIRITEATAGTLTLRTEAGSITVDAAADASATLDARTSYGRIHNTLRNTGTPGLAIHATTSYGDITARSL